MAERIVNEYRPDYVSAPGETLAEVLEIRTMSQSELASRTGRTAKHINEIIKGKARITPETSLQFERALGIPASFWNSRERDYNEFVARRNEAVAIRANLQWATLFPYKEMAKRGWVENIRDRAKRLSNLLNFFGVASPAAWNAYWNGIQIAYRVSQSYQPDRYALAAWLRRGELTGQRLECQPFDADKFRHCLSQARSLTREPASVFKGRLIELGAACGVAVAFVRELPETASGATRWLAPDKALLQLSLKYKTDDQLWFTFFHEAAHILSHHKKSIFIEGGERSSKEEKEANRFAADFLIPPAKYRLLAASPRLTCETIRSFAEDLGIAPGIVVGRLQKEKRLPYSQCNRFKKQLFWKA